MAKHELDKVDEAVKSELALDAVDALDAKMTEQGADIKDEIVLKRDDSPPVTTSLLPDSQPALHSPLKHEGGGLHAAERDQKRSGSSRLPSPEEGGRSRRKAATRSPPAGPTQTAEHLPVANEEAMKNFVEIRSNSYQNNKVGRSRGYKKEAMTCECHYRQGVDDPMSACGEDVGCINRVTQVECRESDCNCGVHCQNQRFQKHQFAQVEIVQTEKKGFGLRAAQDVLADRLIYEYIGEVVEQSEFMRRMQQYKDEGIRHYYFMMLQREEFLDATKKGGVARFINHSCNPNCFVSKWHVGKHMRMGIFSKRDIAKGEELTFNYNVDRYGNEAQTCYCGEPNCVGAIGGKTQTDIGGMDQLFLDALGIADEVDRLDARGTRKKKSRHLDEDYTPLLRPMEEDEVAKVITAVRQAASNRTILQKLLTRIHMTQDADVQRSIVRLHGFILMAGVLDEWKDDKEIILLAMGSLVRWPLIARNKVVDSGVDTLVQELSTSDDAEISSLARDLLSAWDALEMSYRIARREANDSHTFSLERRRLDDVEDVAPVVSLEEARAPNTVSKRLDTIAPKPLVKASRMDGGLVHRHSTGAYAADAPPHATPNRSKYKHEAHRPSPLSTPQPPARAAVSIEEIIRKANESEAALRRHAAEAASAAAAAAATASKAEADLSNNGFSIGVKRRSSLKLSSKSSEKRLRTSEAGAEKAVESALEAADRRLKKLVGEIVVRCMSSYKDDLDRDVFKKHAKDLTTIICDKEKRNPKVWPPRSNDPSAKFMADGFSTEKKGKIKSFVKDYAGKLLAHKSKARTTGPSDRPASASHSIDLSGNGVYLNGKKGTGDDDDVSSVGTSEDRRQSALNGSPTSSSVQDRDVSNDNGNRTTASTASTATTSTSYDQAVPGTPLDPVLLTPAVAK